MKIFDTLNCEWPLEDAGVRRERAETHAELFAEIILGAIATKSHLD